jgi:hypothetical protein
MDGKSPEDVNAVEMEAEQYHEPVSSTSNRSYHSAQTCLAPPSQGQSSGHVHITEIKIQHSWALRKPEESL